MTAVVAFLVSALVLATEPSGTVARVVSVEGATVTLEVLSGSVVTGDALELFNETGKVNATVTAPRGIDLMLAGDRVPGVTLSVPAPAGSLLGERGLFSSLAAISARVPSGARAAAPPPPSPAPPELRPSPRACAYSDAELTRALGFRVNAGTGTELAAGADATSFSCTWKEASGVRSVILNRTVVTSADPRHALGSTPRVLAGRLEPIAGDADGAAWQVEQGDLTGVTLHYVRGNAATELRVMGVDVKKPAVVRALRARVLALPRR